MEQPERDTRNYMTAMQGTLPYCVRGYEVRKLSLETLIVLQMVGSPVAPVISAAMNGKKPSPLNDLQMVDCVVIVWALTENPDDVLRVAHECAPGFAAPATTAAVQFTRGWSPDDVAAVINYVTEDLKATQAAAYDAEVPDMGGGKKKA